MDLSTIKTLLKDNQDIKYRDFSLKLTNNSSLDMIGVRLPLLKQIAKDIAKSGESQDFLNSCDFSSIEMCHLYSYTLEKYRTDIGELLPLFDKAAAHVDNWCTCDILCQSFKQSEKYRSEVYPLILTYMDSGKTFLMRVGVITLMSHFLVTDYLDNIFTLLETRRNDGYYYKMGVAWTLATCYSKFPSETLNFLKTTTIDTFTFNKAIQKMCESRRVEEKDKIILRKLKK